MSSTEQLKRRITKLERTLITQHTIEAAEAYYAQLDAELRPIHDKIDTMTDAHGQLTLDALLLYAEVAPKYEALHQIHEYACRLKRQLARATRNTL